MAKTKIRRLTNPLDPRVAEALGISSAASSTVDFAPMSSERPTKDSPITERAAYCRWLRLTAEQSKSYWNRPLKTHRARLVKHRKRARAKAVALGRLLRSDPTTVPLARDVDQIVKRLGLTGVPVHFKYVVQFIVQYLVDVERQPRTRAYRILSEHIFPGKPETTIRAWHEGNRSKR